MVGEKCINGVVPKELDENPKFSTKRAR